MSRSWGEIAPLRAVVLACVLAGCGSDAPSVNESQKEIESFVFYERDNPALDGDARGTITGRLISLRMPFGTRVKALKPTITHTGVSISPAGDEPQDFSNPVEYTVSGGDGSFRVYTVTVTIAAPSTSKDITSFQIAGVEAAIDGSNISITMPHGTDLSALRGFVSHTGANVKPASGSTQDFSQPLEYIVTARDGSTRSYLVTVNLAPSDAKDITQFKVGDTSAEIKSNEITITLPYGTDLSTIDPVIIFNGTTVTPDDESPDFRDPVLYTVTAADGSTKTYSVEISVAASSAKDISQFSILGVEGTISGSAITLTLPYGTDVSRLIPGVTHTGQSISPATSEPQDFSAPVIYRISAADGSSKEYSVTVIVAAGTSNEITSFSILGCEAHINGNAISLALPFGTSLSALAPSIDYTGISITPASGAPQDFSEPVEYTIAAADGSSRTYTVVLSVASDSAREITSFSILGVSGAIAGHSISLTVPYGTDVTALQPSLAHNGAGIDPGDGQARDFSQPVTYTVTAVDGTTREYLVTVNVAPSMAKEITRFSILGVDGRIGADAIALTVPYGTGLAELAPMIELTGASVQPASGVAQNFGEPITYTVMAADGSTRQYVVTVDVASGSAKEITSFSLAGVDGLIGSSAISLTVPFGTDLHALTPNLSINGRSVSPASGVTQDFSQPVVYTVTAEDGSSRQFTVVIRAALNSAKDILTFSVLEITGTVGADTVNLTVPYGTDVRSLFPQITVSGVEISPSSGVAVDFTNTVSYSVFAEDGSSKQYMVSIGMTAPRDCAAIKLYDPNRPSALYTIDPDGSGAIPSFIAYCDMARNGGGWTLIGKIGAGNYTDFSDTEYLALIANPVTDVNVELLQNELAPIPGQISFFDRPKTNALYNARPGVRAVRVELTGNVSDLNANGTYFQQRISAPANWDFWAALRNALAWNRDGSSTGVGSNYVNYFGVDFVLSNDAADFDPSTNLVTQRGDSEFGHFGTYTHTLYDGSSLTVSRRFGLLGGYNGIHGLWLLTADPTDIEWKNDQSYQCSVIWLR